MRTMRVHPNAGIYILPPASTEGRYMPRPALSSCQNRIIALFALRSPFSPPSLPRIIVDVILSPLASPCPESLTPHEEIRAHHLGLVYLVCISIKGLVPLPPRTSAKRGETQNSQ